MQIHPLPPSPKFSTNPQQTPIPHPILNVYFKQENGACKSPNNGAVNFLNIDLQIAKGEFALISALYQIRATF